MLGMLDNLEGYGIDMKVARAYAASLESHIRFVQIAGRQLGVSDEQLAQHDQSKWSIEEFPHYARHFHGNVSPVDRPFVSTAFAKAWLHHLHQNAHHWQHFIFPDGFSPQGSEVENGVVEMPPNFALEMVADWSGASYAYTDSWNMSGWLRQNMPKIRVHSRTAAYLREVLGRLGYEGIILSTHFAHEIS
jgi:hypothetical protein